MDLRKFVQLALMVFLVDLELSRGAATVRRDLTGYDKAVADYAHSFQPSYVGADLANFIWTHWKQRRRGYVLVRLVTPQGKELLDITEQLFIEPSKNGSWCIHGVTEIDITELRWVPASQEKPPRHVKTEFEGVSLEWGGTYRHLILKDKAGKEIDSFWVEPRE
jgi:hypothetical protein